MGAIGKYQANHLGTNHKQQQSGYGYIGTMDSGLPYKHLKWLRLYEMILN